MAPDAAGGANMSGIVKLVVKSFLERKHYCTIHRVLSDQWGGCHSLSAAIRLMEAHGVTLSADEERRVQQLPEDRMIDALVMKMPQQSREQFEHFFLQLSFIASTTTRLRQALEGGDPAIIEEALESAENVGVLPYIMKMAVSQAGHEVKLAESEHDAWLSEADGRMGPLLQSSQTSVMTQKMLSQVKLELSHYRGEAKEKSKSVLLSMSEGNDKALVTSCFSSWQDYFRRQRRENEIRAEYQAEIDAANKALFEYKKAQMQGVRNIFDRNSKEGDVKMLINAVAALAAEAEEFKQREETRKEVDALNARINAFAEASAVNAKKVMARIGEGNDDTLTRMVWSGWKDFVAAYKKDKQIEDDIKIKEQAIEEFKKKQTEGAQSVLHRMANATNEGLISGVVKGWWELTKEAKEGEQMTAILTQKANALAGFSQKNKGSAMSATEKTAFFQDLQLTLYVFGVWKKDSLCESLKRRLKDKNNKRKKDLDGVKGLFKNFASELDQNLSGGTPRIDSPSGQTAKRRGRSSGGSPGSAGPA